MTKKLGKEILNVAEGAALVEAADSGLVENAFGELQHVFGSNVEFMPSELGELGTGVEHLVDTAQAFTLPLATVMIAYAGMKHMLKPLSSRE
ncbi:MAG: hypothetical protein A3B30_00435 [Candidatus Komeilibacteria bacterium RIFCSPLOWO2_01_FULL_52_15]|uniref:Uncharacterized protein n=1 Tax=Candidatus Komeilibacteria bacterium RIFCSPLOWO2_01_FULL_52_15 TaxID=1798551 RepID=A0A1G2BRT2_9BACT|nr:MAG: hypothetical protein A3B30_00435 [Candidatus Komeilibacteria bacterium RIFCSPLOWO2_01_FULL_52_15]